MRNVLIGSVGRQRTLIGTFRDAARGRCSVLAMDADPWAPALGEGDRAIPALSFTDEHYGEWLLATCEQHDVGLLLTLHEGELAAMEGVRSALEAVGTRLVGSPRHSVECFSDKWKLSLSLHSEGIATPPTWLGSDAGLERQVDRGPLLAKPRRGRGSRGILALQDHEAVRDFLARPDADAFVVQPVIVGEEFGLDVVNDLEGTTQAVLQRRKLRMSGGETDRAVSIASDALDALGRALGSWTQHQGVFDVDVLMAEGGEPLIIDVNPRFGGGHAFSQVAGARVAEAIFHWHLAPGQPFPEAFLACRVGVSAQRVTQVLPVPQDVAALHPKG